MCQRHGAKKFKRCSSEGCTNIVVKGGVCIKHGAKKFKRCSSEGAGVCKKHAETHSKKQCSSEGCTNQAYNEGVCIRHGANVLEALAKQCSIDGCANQAKRGGVCIKHGAKRKLDEQMCWRHGLVMGRKVGTSGITKHIETDI